MRQGSELIYPGRDVSAADSLCKIGLEEHPLLWQKLLHSEMSYYPPSANTMNHNGEYMRCKLEETRDMICSFLIQCLRLLVTAIVLQKGAFNRNTPMMFHTWRFPASCADLHASEI